MTKAGVPLTPTAWASAWFFSSAAVTSGLHMSTLSRASSSPSRRAMSRTAGPVRASPSPSMASWSARYLPWAWAASAARAASSESGPRIGSSLYTMRRPGSAAFSARSVSDARRQCGQL